MPLEKAPVGSPGFSRNVETEVKAGKPVAQAVAIAYKMAGEKRGDAANAAIYEENGEFYFPKPGSHERYGPYASKAEATSAAAKAGVVGDAERDLPGEGTADDDEAILGRKDANPAIERRIKDILEEIKDHRDMIQSHKRIAAFKEKEGDFSSVREYRWRVSEGEKYIKRLENQISQLRSRKDSDEAILGRSDAGPSADDLEKEYNRAESEFEKILAQYKQADRDLKRSKTAANRQKYVQLGDQLERAGDKARNLQQKWHDRLNAEERLAKYKSKKEREGKQLGLFDAKARKDAAPTIVREGNQWIISVDEGGSVSIFRLDVSEYPTEADALEYALSNPQYTNRKDSLPALDRALAAADALYAKADAAGDKTYVVKYDNSVDKTGIIEVKAGSRDEAQTKAKKELGGECKRIFYVSEIASRSDAERDLPGSSTTEGNYGIDAKASK